MVIFTQNDYQPFITTLYLIKLFHMLPKACQPVTYAITLLNHIAPSVRSKTFDQQKAALISHTIIPHFFLISCVLGLHITYKIKIFIFVTVPVLYSAPQL